MEDKIARVQDVNENVRKHSPTHTTDAVYQSNFMAAVLVDFKFLDSMTFRLSLHTKNEFVCAMCFFMMNDKALFIADESVVVRYLFVEGSGAR